MPLNAPLESPFHSLMESPLHALMRDVPPSPFVVDLHAPMTRFFTPFTATDLQVTWDGPVGYPYGSRYRRVNTSLETQGVEQVLCGVRKYSNPIAPYTWQLKTGSLPPGISLSTSAASADVQIIGASSQEVDTGDISGELNVLFENTETPWNHLTLEQKNSYEGETFTERRTDYENKNAVYLGTTNPVTALNALARLVPGEYASFITTGLAWYGMGQTNPVDLRVSYGGDRCYFTGTPSAVGDYTFTVGVKKNGLWRGERECQIRTIKPIAISNLGDLNIFALGAQGGGFGWEVQSVLFPMSEPATSPPSKFLYYEGTVSLTVQPHASYWGMGYKPSGQAGSPSYVDVHIAWNSGLNRFAFYFGSNIAGVLTYQKTSDFTSPVGTYEITNDFAYQLAHWPNWIDIPATITIAEA